MNTLPEPLTPPECDLRDFAFMPFDVRRFRDSDLVSFEEPEIVLAAIMLWSASWHQVPAASLPDDDRALAQFAGYGRAVKEWKRIREGAMRNFVKCSDGRLYHSTVAEKANEAWLEKRAYRDRKSKRTEAAKTAANARWHDAERSADGCDTHEQVMHDASRNGARRNTSSMPKGTGTGTGTVEGKHQAQPPNLNSNLEPTREKPPEGIADAATAFNYVCREADWRPANDTQRQNGIGILAGWLALGCTLELILEGIGRARKRDPSATRSLKRFDSTIRGMRRDQVGELPVSPSDVRAVTDGVAKRLAVN